ncbi:MAG: hypothetical protein IJK23_12045 [Clostridia bacterium]|nr:hypothetical protein [Clostridia bacterium]
MKNGTEKLFHRLIALLVAAVLLCGAFPVAGAASAPEFEYLTCPQEAVSPFEDAILDRASGGDDLLSNRGYEETGLYVSPYWTCRASGTAVPVYAAMCYDGVPDRGVLSSFVYLFVSDFADGIELELDRGENVKNAVVLPTTLGVAAEVRGSTVRFTADKTGVYTCLINDDCLLDAVTVFVRDCPDEEAEIASYRERYGEDRVKVFPAGRYDLDCIDVSGCDALYFRRGAYICATHLFDVRKEGDVSSRPAFLDFYNKTGAVIDGFGILDFNRLDRNEISYINITHCVDCSVEGLLCLNPAGWNFVAYADKGLTVRDIAVFGYRTNSDALNICGCENVTVSDCFARSGDDSFSAKTTNTEYALKHIRFENCVGWSDKCRAFGITGEVYSPMEDVVFADCAVLYRNATWDNDRVCSLAVSVEYGGADISDVLFENIEIYRDTGRAIFVMVTNKELQNCKIKGVVFRNVNYTADVKGRLASVIKPSDGDKIRLWFFRLFKQILPFGWLDGKLEQPPVNGNGIEVTFDNVTANGCKLTRANFTRFFTTSGNEDLIFK